MKLGGTASFMWGMKRNAGWPYTEQETVAQQAELSFKSTDCAQIQKKSCLLLKSSLEKSETFKMKTLDYTYMTLQKIQLYKRVIQCLIF